MAKIRRKKGKVKTKKKATRTKKSKTAVPNYDDDYVLKHCVYTPGYGHICGYLETPSFAPGVDNLEGECSHADLYDAHFDLLYKHPVNYRAVYWFKFRKKRNESGRSQ